LQVRVDNSLEHNANRFWELETVEQPSMTLEQLAFEQHIISTKTEGTNERFVVRLPIKMDLKQLGASCLFAERRMHAIECRLGRQPHLKTKYHEFMKEYEELGHMEPVNFQELMQPCYFLPHNAVFNF